MGDPCSNEAVPVMPLRATHILLDNGPEFAFWRLADWVMQQ